MAAGGETSAFRLAGLAAVLHFKGGEVERQGLRLRWRVHVVRQDKFNLDLAGDPDRVQHGVTQLAQAISAGAAEVVVAALASIRGGLRKIGQRGFKNKLALHAAKPDGFQFAQQKGKEFSAHGFIVRNLVSLAIAMPN
jgi:hypothetical protein